MHMPSAATATNRSAHRRIKLYAAIAVAGGIAPALALADSILPVGNEGNLYLSQSWASTGPGQTPATVTGTGVSGSAAPGQPLVTVSDLTQNGNITANYGFGQSFTAPTGSYSAGTLANGNQFGFTASYVIDVPASTAGAYLFSLNLNASSGLDNLTARLYEYNANGIQNLTLGSTGAVNPGLVEAWSTSQNGYVASTTLSPTNVPSGEYVLEVAGLTVGSTSGAYSGQLSITPVPLPASFFFLLSGLAGLVGVNRFRSRPVVSLA
jgi:hypothetical protein